ncbi:TatD family hydrolase [Patescibacteria group bacterium]|nr:TatD family hydrolase [Patescibacteria group bacterium]
MKLIDTHCHLNFKDFDKDRDKIIGLCLDNNINIINIGVDYESSKQVIELAEKYKGVYACVATHPHNVGKEKFNLKELAKKAIGIGETGLDYAFCENNKKLQELQKKVFKQHLELAQELNKPVIIHSRRLFPEILEIVKEYNIKAVLHCYMGRWSYAQEYLKLGYYLSFTGLICYARDYDKVIKNCPLDRILVETDAPYLSPIKGERNTPLNIKAIVEKIAEIKGESFEKTAKQTTENAKKLFNLV